MRERIGHVCPTAFRHADPTVFADWIPGPIPWPITGIGYGWCEVELARDFRPNSLSRTAPLPARPTIHAGVFSTGHTASAFLDRPSWERFPCGVRGVGRIRTSGACAPLLSGQSHSDRSANYSTDPHGREQTGRRIRADLAYPGGILNPRP